MYNKKSSVKFVRRPEFNVIGNLYDELMMLRNKYGIEQIILHLGEVAKETVSKDLASKVWSILNMENRVDVKNLKDGE